MIDGTGRTIDYLRISLTDRCNLRCVYCMPEEGVCSVCHEEILNYEEILKLAEIFASLGISKIKLTGGEPLVRKNVPRLVKELKKISGISQVTLTTNGILLEEMIEDLYLAKADGINLSLDTLNPEIYKKITRRDCFEKTMEGFRAALKYPEILLKINCVPMGMEGQNVTELAELARMYPVHVRYIEMMPIGLGKSFDCFREEDILKALESKYGEAVPWGEKLGNGPGHYYSFDGFQGKIGFISAVSHKFCGECNRIRLTSQGFLKSCLQYDVGADLKELLRGGSTAEEIREVIQQAILKKPAAHQFEGQAESGIEKNMMSQFGG